MVAHGLLGATLIFLGLHVGEIWPWPLRPSRVIFWRALALEKHHLCAERSQQDSVVRVI